MVFNGQEAIETGLVRMNSYLGGQVWLSDVCKTPCIQVNIVVNIQDWIERYSHAQTQDQVDDRQLCHRGDNKGRCKTCTTE